MKEGQIKGKRQAAKLTETLHFISRDAGEKSRHVIVQFVMCNDRKNVFNRKNIKGKNIVILRS